MNSIQIRRFQSALESYIREQDLPTEVKRLALKEIYDHLCVEVAREISQQIRAESEEKKHRKIFHEDPEPLQKAEE